MLIPGQKSSEVLMRWSFEPLEDRRLLSVGVIPAVPTPAAHWTFDEGAGSSAADTSGHGFTATLGSGAAWVNGNIGAKGMGLTGTAAGVATVTGPVVNTASSFTVSAWVNLSSLSGYQTAVSIAGTSVAGFYLGLRGDTGTFSFARLGSDATGGATVIASPNAPSTGTWYHLVGVSDSSAKTLTLYLDGQSVGTVNYTGAWNATGNTLIGHGFYGGNQVDFVNGSIDDVQFFSSALSAAQVAVLDNTAAYSFDDGTGTTAADVSGNGNSLTLAGGASWTTGRIGSNALAVDGTATGNALFASPVVDTSRPFSVSAWVKLDSLSTFQTIASIDGTNVSAFFLQYRSDAGRFAFTRLASDAVGATTYTANATAAPTAGTWYHLLGVNDVANGRIQLYVNGTLQASTAYTAGWQGTGATVVGAGKYNGGPVDFVKGQIDEVRFYNAALNASAAAYIGTAGSSTITINTASTGVTVSPDLLGAFMEDINYGGEGGIYNDEVRNAGFNDSSNALNAWSAVVGTGVSAALASDATTGPTSALTKSGKLTITSGVSATARAGIANTGYFGVAVKPYTAYSVEFYAKATSGLTGPITVSLDSTGGTVWVSGTVPSLTTSWTKYTVTLTTGGSVPSSSANRLVLSTTSPSANGATIWFGSAHLFPPSYAGATTNHLRADLMEMLAALKPAVFRVPGGNYLEGNSYADRFNWSQTIGRLEDRPGHYNSAWGYWSTDGMGLDEYLQMAEEVGARPLLAVYAGYTLKGTSDTGSVLTADVTDAINELHYVLDPVTTSWGALRAANGHPDPYDVREVEVGNEDFFSSTYATRYPLFYDAIRAAFPSLKIVATHTATGGRPYDILDEHNYSSPQWFQNNQGAYDGRTRGSFKIMVGEYAANQGNPTNNMLSALGDATWLTGLMRNSDLVTMSMYAPIWANVNGIQWSPDLIGFDTLSSFGSPTYYVQAMLAGNHGSTVVNNALTGASGLRTIVTRSGPTYYLTVINTLGSSNPATINLSGVTTVSPTGTAITLAAGASNDVNTIANPGKVIPVTSSVSGLDTSFTYTFSGYSVTILKFTAGDNAAPTVATAAAATPATVTGTSTSLSALGADDGGEANLTYTWSLVGTPPASVSFSANGTNAARKCVANFIQAGTYVFRVTISDGVSQVTSNVTVVVNSTRTDAEINGSTAAIASGQTRQFSANVLDQFGEIMGGATVTWSLGAGSVGSINSTGLYTASGTGQATIIATSGPVSASITLAVNSAGPSFVTPASASPATVTGTTVNLSALATDDGGEAALTYTWSLVSGPAPVQFTSNGQNASKNATATFRQSGAYTFKVTATDATGRSASSSVAVTVNQTASSVVLSPTTVSLGTSQTRQFTAAARDQFDIAMGGSAITWTIVSGSGTISSTGLFTAGTSASKTVIRAASGALSATATITSFAWSPYSLMARKATSNTVAISFRDSTTIETGFQLQVGKRLSTGVIQWTTTYVLGVASGSGSTVNYTIPTTFTAGTYAFRVRAKSGATYSNWSNTAVLTV